MSGESIQSSEVTIIVDPLGHVAYESAVDSENLIVLYVNKKEHKTISDISLSICHLLLISKHSDTNPNPTLKEVLDRDRWDLYQACKQCGMATEAFFLLYECVKKYGIAVEKLNLAVVDKGVSKLAFEWVRCLASTGNTVQIPNITLYPANSFTLTPPSWVLAIDKLNSQYAYGVRRKKDGEFASNNSGLDDVIRSSAYNYAHIYHPYSSALDSLKDPQTGESLRVGLTPENSAKIDAIQAISKVLFPEIFSLLENRHFKGNKILFDVIDDDILNLQRVDGYSKDDSTITKGANQDDNKTKQTDGNDRQTTVGKNNNVKDEKQIFLESLYEFKVSQIHPKLQQEFNDFSAFLNLLINYDKKIHDNSLVFPFFNLLDQSNEKRTENIIFLVSDVQDKLYEQEIKQEVARLDSCIDKYKAEVKKDKGCMELLAESAVYINKNLVDIAEFWKRLAGNTDERIASTINETKKYLVNKLDNYEHIDKEEVKAFIDDCIEAKGKIPNKWGSKEKTNLVDVYKENLEALGFNTKELSRIESDIRKTDKEIDDCKNNGLDDEESNSLEEKIRVLESELEEQKTSLKQQENQVNSNKGELKANLVMIFSCLNTKDESLDLTRIGELNVTDNSLLISLCPNIKGKEIPEIKTNYMDAKAIQSKLKEELKKYEVLSIDEGLAKECFSLRSDLTIAIERFVTIVESEVARGNLAAVDLVLSDDRFDFRWQGSELTEKWLEHELDEILYNETNPNKKGASFDLGIISGCPNSLVGVKADDEDNSRIKEALYLFLSTCMHSPKYIFDKQHFRLFDECEGVAEVFGQLVARYEVVKDKREAIYIVRLIDKLLVRLSQQELNSIKPKGWTSKSLTALLRKTNFSAYCELQMKPVSYSNFKNRLFPKNKNNSIFICYSQSDGMDYIDSISREIKNRENDVNIFTDKKLEWGNDWIHQLSHMIDLAATVIIILTDDMLTNQVYSSGFIRNYESKKIASIVRGNRPEGREKAKVWYVDATKKYTESNLVSHVFGSELLQQYHTAQRVTAEKNGARVLSEDDLDNLMSSIKIDKPGKP